MVEKEKKNPNIFCLPSTPTAVLIALVRDFLSFRDTLITTFCCEKKNEWQRKINKLDRHSDRDFELFLKVYDWK